MISSLVTRTSAAVLLIGGAALLFAPDAILPQLVPDFPPGAFWLGQLVAAAWLGVAALNWLQRSALLGGIYGRPIVFANLALYFVGALSLVRALLDPAASRSLWFVAAPMGLFALVYGALLLRSPFDPISQPSAP